MKMLKLMPLLLTVLLLTGAIALADEIVIVHRSGKIETIKIDSDTDPVEQVNFRKTEKTETKPALRPEANRIPTPPVPAKTPQPDQETRAQPKPSEPEQKANKPNIKIKWAQPMEAQ